MSLKKYDLIVIGAGSGGLGAAMGMNKLGLKVLLIDKTENNFGGECVNTGCIPSKALLHVAKQVHEARMASQFGLEAAGKVDISKVKNYIWEKQEHILAHENAEYLQNLGIDVAIGTASFVSKKEIMVNDEIYTGRNIVLATGSSPRIINIKGADAIPIFTNENIFNIDFLPEHFVFIGAGPVSVELAQAFFRLGSKVSVVIRGNRILKKEDPEISDILMKKLQEEGIEFYFNSEVKEIQEGTTAVLEKGSGEEKTIPVNALFMGLGRQLDFSSLDLEKGGIKTKKGKMILNQKLQTTNKNVFVSGDAADNLKFSHAAELHNMLLINNFISPKKKKLNFDHFPWVTFSDPEVATFGLNEKKLKKRGKKYERLEIDLGEADKAVTDSFEYGKLLLFIEKKRWNPGNAKILGGSMVAPNAGEITQELVLASVSGLTLQNFMDKIYAYPTAGNINKIAIRERIIKQIDPWMKALIRTWYRFKE